MAMKRAEILTPWTVVETPLGATNYPLVAVEFGLTDYQDITGQQEVIPDPNLFSLAVECDESVLAQIELDERFFIVSEEYT